MKAFPNLNIMDLYRLFAGNKKKTSFLLKKHDYNILENLKEEKRKKEKNKREENTNLTPLRLKLSYFCGDATSNL